MHTAATRRAFLQTLGASAGAAAALGFASLAFAEDKPIQGFEKSSATPDQSKDYRPISDRKLRVGLVGYGVCKFSAAFGFQDHPSAQVVAVSDLVPDRCAALAKEARCATTYPDYPRHARL